MDDKKMNGAFGENGTEQEKPSDKLFFIIAAAVLVFAVVIGGIVLVTNKKQDAKAASAAESSTTAADISKEAAKAHGDENAQEVITGEDALNDAKVKDADAFKKVQSLSREQLGLSEKDYKRLMDEKNTQYSFMQSGQAYVIDGEKYVMVTAAEKKKNKDGTFSINEIKRYYISFDGKTIMTVHPKKAGEYQKIR